MRFARLIPFILAGTFLLSQLASPKFGVVKTRARFAMFHPPAFHASNGELRLQVDSLDSRHGLTMAPRIEQSLEEGLLRSYFKVTPDARTLLQCTLTDSTAHLEPAVREESVNVHVGEHTEQGSDGKPKIVEDCQVRNSLVTYLVSVGHLAMDVKAKDTRAGTLLMNQLVERGYRRESAIFGPRRCGGASYGVLGAQFQDPFVILGFLGDEVVNDTLTLATGFDEPREVLLAVDDPLKPGNAQAVAGAWREALDTWTSSSAHNKPGEAARLYNLGVAHEAMAAMAMRNWKLDDAASHLFESQESYSQALKIDPEEKYFRDTMARLQIDQHLLHQQLRQASEESDGASGRPGKPAPGSSSAAPLDGWPSGESAPVHDYRVYVRTRLGAEKGRPTEALKQALLAGAADYGVEPDAGLRVLDSEVERASVLRQNLETYRADFQAAAADGLITPDERQMLRKRQQILHVSDNQAKEIESQFKFQETDQD